MNPKMALTETALALIHHAEHDIPSAATVSPRAGRARTTSAGYSTDPRDWLRETALLRLMSIIEAYVDAVSMHRMGKVLDQRQMLVSLMVGDFELASSGTWQDRHDSYERYHGFTLRSRDRWEAINAGIEVRNCLMHGMGNLTAKQRTQTKLATVVKVLEVTIGSNRMYMSAATVPKLADACTAFVKHVDGSIDLTRP
jgi:hypothetical protein